MSATIHLVLGPPGSPRRERLIAACRETSREFGSSLFLVPSRRHAAQVREELGTVVAPMVMDFQSFADEVVRTHDPTVRPHSDSDRLLLLESVLAELGEREELPYFERVAETRGYAEAAAGYVAELQAAGVDSRRLVKASPQRDSAGSPGRHTQATRIFQRYQSRLLRLHRLDASDRVGRAAQHWVEGKQRPFERVLSVYLSGFTSFSRLQKKLVESLRDTVEHLWIELPEGDGEPFREVDRVRTWFEGSQKGNTLLSICRDVEVKQVGLNMGLARANNFGRLFVGAEVVSSPPPETGLTLIEAPGELGEARLVARQIRTLLAAGNSADRILVVTRTLGRSTADLYREVFDEYAIPQDVEGAEALSRAPAVAFLLQAWRLQVDNWPFPAVAAILRSSYFRPNWPEAAGDPEVAAKSETLLRMLGEPRDRDCYLKAVHTWEHTPPEPLEDEQAEEPIRKRKQKLAALCRPFLERFFKAWDRIKVSGTGEAVVIRLKAFADDIGLSLAAERDVADAAGLARFWRELDRWASADSAASGRKAVRPERFQRVLSAIAAVAGRGRTGRGGGRVKVLSAEAAAGLDCDYLFLIELGEGTWPNLSPPVSLLDDAERERLRRHDIPVEDPAARLAREQLLFLSLVTAPQRGLFLSYAAVDDRGQPLLLSSFLRELKALFPKDTIPVLRQRMLLDGYFDREPLSSAELRVQVARSWGQRVPDPPLEPDLIDNLNQAALVARARFQSHDFGPYDGSIKHLNTAAELERRFSPQKIFSPTALEAYVACPFRFWLEHVLRLEPLEDPSEEVEKTRRGAAFHRALARFHGKLKTDFAEALVGQLTPAVVTDELVAQIDRAVEEYAARSPSRATAELWRLEGVRLKRAAKRYGGHWNAFRKPWREKNALPKPRHFEADFGVPAEVVTEPLVISVDGVEVRIGGRIDRVDVAELGDSVGFWVIDYKTGRATNYQASQVERLEKLQLPLYALAVERVILKGDRPARPLGLAYWLVTDTGPKPMLPATKTALLSWLLDPGRWERFRTQLEAWVASLVKHIRSGDFPLAPRSETCTDVCAFGPVCRIAQSRNSGKVFPLPLPTIIREKETKTKGTNPVD